jgi:hypothetical protein
VEKLSWIILLLFAAGLVIAVIKGGWTGPGGGMAWFKTKFLGQVSS